MIFKPPSMRTSEIAIVFVWKFIETGVADMLSRVWCCE